MKTKQIIALLRKAAEFGIEEMDSENINIDSIISKIMDTEITDKIDEAELHQDGRGQCAEYGSWNCSGDITHFDNPHVIKGGWLIQIEAFLKGEYSDKGWDIVYPIDRILYYDSRKNKYSVIWLYVHE